MATYERNAAAKITRMLSSWGESLRFRNRQGVNRFADHFFYLREHEQMYWIQWHLARMRGDPAVMGRSTGLGL
ncbi:hypothetical protein V8F06_001539 [Rhypophila decipiens]